MHNELAKNGVTRFLVNQELVPRSEVEHSQWKIRFRNTTRIDQTIGRFVDRDEIHNFGKLTIRTSSLENFPGPVTGLLLCIEFLFVLCLFVCLFL